MSKEIPLSQLIDLSNKVAVVTGGAMGIGFGIAYRLAEAGANVVIADIDESAGKDAVVNLVQQGFKAVFAKTNVAEEAEVYAAIDLAIVTYGGVDIVVNNAGIYPIMPLMQMPLIDYERILSTNLRSVFLFTKAAASQMIKQGRGGKIINITSIDAIHPSSVGLAVYDASKHGLWGFTKNSALELSKHNIQVNAIAPGGIRTPGTGEGKPVMPEVAAIQAKFINKIPMGRMGDPDEIGTVALFLSSGLASYITGSQIVVDGGALLS